MIANMLRKMFSTCRTYRGSLATGLITALFLGGSNAGVSLWKYKISATIGMNADIIKCVPLAMNKFTEITIDRVNISYQYKVVPVEMILSGGTSVHGDVGRSGPTTLIIAFFGRQEEEPVVHKAEIKEKLEKLREAVQVECHN